MGKRVVVDCSQNGRTQQHFRDQCNINTIVDRAKKSGMVTHVNGKTPQYLDVSNQQSYHQAMDIVLRAEYYFNSLPAKIRERFLNDPEQLLNFIQNNENYEEAVRLGLVEPKKPEPKSEVKPDPVVEVKTSEAVPPK